MGDDLVEVVLEDAPAIRVLLGSGVVAVELVFKVLESVRVLLLRRGEGVPLYAGARLGNSIEL